MIEQMYYGGKEFRSGVRRKEGAMVDRSNVNTPVSGGVDVTDRGYATQLYEQAADKQDFICFLHFCSERLGRGETVQSTWLGYQEIAAQKSK